MRALSVRQPWAWLIIQGHKPVENRSRRTSHRGPLLIHAAKGMTSDEYGEAKLLAHSLGVTVPDFDELERGGIVGQVDVIDCVTEHPSPYFFGKYGYVLKDAQPLPFREYKGQLGIFEVQDMADTSLPI